MLPFLLLFLRKSDWRAWVALAATSLALCLATGPPADLPSRLATLLERIEQVIRLVRSKGVGVYFVTQNPLDIPDTVLGQLGNRVQHALRAFTPRDQKAVKAAATTFRHNPPLDVETAITNVRSWRSKCVVAATRRARTALEHDGGLADQPLEGEWLNYAALLVQVDRIIGYLSALVVAMAGNLAKPRIIRKLAGLSFFRISLAWRRNFAKPIVTPRRPRPSMTISRSSPTTRSATGEQVGAWRSRATTRRRLATSRRH